MGSAIVADLQAEVLQVFADVTRYPQDVLDLEANLEEDLGVDSVKLGEVFAVLKERFHLPAKLDIPLERLKTISGISVALSEYVALNGNGRNGAAHPVAVAVAPQVEDTPRNGAVKPGNVQDRVMKIFAEVTRYPAEVLDVTADLEEDLGIDSVKLGEIFAVLREEYHLPEKLDLPAENLRTIRSIASSLEQYLLGRNGDNGASSGAAGAVVALNGRAAVVVNGRTQPSIAAPIAHRPFTGKVGFVSGSGRGLGKDIASYLAELGATVVVNSFHSRERGEETVDEIASHGGEAWHVWGSMANPAQLHKMFDQIEERYGRLDFFISNASNGMLASVEDLTVEHWEKAFRTNVIGLHQGALRAAGLMRKNGGGKMITLSSPAAHGYVEYFGCMGSVKAAVECLTRALAIEFAKYNIQVNCVSPGPIDGELLRKWPDSDRLIKQWTDSTPLGRLCNSREVSHFIAYLLSEPVRAFTGSVLVLDGGISSQGW